MNDGNIPRMPQSFVKILIVFSNKDRGPIISPEIKAVIQGVTCNFAIQFAIVRFFLSVCLLAISTGWIYAQHRTDEPISDELYSTVETRAALIRNELATTKDIDWAGTYFQGDHHPTILTLSPENGFLVTASLHTFSPSWVNFGKVVFEEDRVRLFPDLGEKEKSSHVLPSEFILIRWGDVRFLVPEPELKLFAYDVNSRSPHLFSDYFAKRFDEEPKGLPVLPPPYARFLSMKTLAVTAISQERDDVVVVNAGSNKGVIEGMSFYLVGRRSVWMMIRVKKVLGDRAECQIYSRGTSLADQNLLNVKKGWKFVSRAPKSYIAY